MPLPSNQQALNDARQALRNRDLKRAESLYRHILTLNPEIRDAHNELGIALLQQGQYREATDAFRAALDRQTSHLQARNNLGIALHQLAEFDQAMAAHEAAIRLNPTWPIPHINLSMLLLLKGDYPRGFAEHEWRLKLPGLRTRPQEFPQPMWDGAPLNGRRILIHPEQGFGDSIQFVRFIPQVVARGGRVILSSPPELHPLFQQLPDVVQFVTRGDRLPPFDLHCPLLSLPHALKTDLATLPCNIPYLQADRVKIEFWANRVAEAGTRLKVGIAWTGSTSHGANLDRSIPIHLLEQITAVPGISFFSLQRDASASRTIDWTNELRDFADTAGLIHHLDLVITIDTAVAHLAGAMGKPVWLMLPFIPDWRWMLERTDSPWYPTMQLIRQPQRNDWQSPIDQVLTRLRSRHPLD